MIVFRVQNINFDNAKGQLYFYVLMTMYHKFMDNNISKTNLLHSMYIHIYLCKCWLVAVVALCT